MNLSHRRITPKELRENGWERMPKPKHHFGASFKHRDGWKITHCGHPTAIWPYVLENPAGRMILTGIVGPLKRPDYGVAWPSIASAVDYVASLKEVA